MGEFAKWTKLEATAALQRISGQGPTPGMNPVVELIGCLLEDGSGGIDAPANSPITTEAWLIWNGLALEWPTELAELIETVLETERLSLPTEPLALRNWAACLLLTTLDRWGMT
jgi:hypothetical protein